MSEIEGKDALPAGIGAALRLIGDRVEARRGAAHFRLLHNGQVVTDRAFGCPPGTRFLIFSSGKPLLAALVHLLADRGHLSLDDTVAHHWPQFDRRGKDAITIRHVLQHRAGLPVARGLILDGLTAPNWRRSTSALAAARPRFPPGEVPAYHILSFGYILGEVVERVTGGSVRDVMRTQLLEPLGMDDTSLGLTDGEPHLPVRSQGRGLALQMHFNRRTIRRAVIPAATVTSTAADLSRFYQMMLDDGVSGGRQILSPSAVRQALTPSSDMETDGLLGVPVRWSHGFQLGGPCPVASTPRPLGSHSSRSAFGHNGSGCCVGWADPSRRLVLVYLSNLLSAEFTSSPHQSAVSDAVLSAYPRADIHPRSGV